MRIVCLLVTTLFAFSANANDDRLHILKGVQIADRTLTKIENEDNLLLICLKIGQFESATNFADKRVVELRKHGASLSDNELALFDELEARANGLTGFCGQKGQRFPVPALDLEKLHTFGIAGLREKIAELVESLTAE